MVAMNVLYTFTLLKKKKHYKIKLTKHRVVCNQFLLMLFKAQTKDPKRSWFDFFYTVFFGNVCKCSLQKKKPKKKLRFIGS